MKQNGSLHIDDSNIENGVITVQNLKKDKRKIMVESHNHRIYYDIYSSPIVIPLQFGHGVYDIALLENTIGNKYKSIGTIRLVVKITHPLGMYLLPNVYVDYTEQSACVLKAKEICGTYYAAEYKFEKIKKYVEKHFRYSFIHALVVSGKNYLPKVDETFKRGWGICQDLAAVVAAMLRSQGVPTKFVVGLANKSPHAWVKVFYKNEWQLYDPTKAIRKITKEFPYTEQRWY